MVEEATDSNRSGAKQKLSKCINTTEDLNTFTSSSLCEQLVSFICELSEAVRGVARSPDRINSASMLIRGLSEMLDEVNSWIDEFPPVQQSMRFGNKAFCKWHARLSERAEGLLSKVLRDSGSVSLPGSEALASELSHYLIRSFGDERRIDYGTGHETNFFAILFALGARGVLSKTDAADVVLLVFVAYLRVMRRLQTVYLLEPAGSHGVWGLDDFHMLPFLFGSSQLVGLEDEVSPGDVYKEHIVKHYADTYLYVDAIHQVLLAKRGAEFHETSPVLYSITSIPQWLKIYGGLVKMYRAEVLGKFPVIQHFLFGTIIRWPGCDPKKDQAVPEGQETLGGFSAHTMATVHPSSSCPKS